MDAGGREFRFLGYLYSQESTFPLVIIVVICQNIVEEVLVFEIDFDFEKCIHVVFNFSWCKNKIKSVGNGDVIVCTECKAMYN